MRTCMMKSGDFLILIGELWLSVVNFFLIVTIVKAGNTVYQMLIQVTETGATSLILICGNVWLTVRNPFLTACWSLWFTEILALH